jgi:hypothetical protein
MRAVLTLFLAVGVPTVPALGQNPGYAPTPSAPGANCLLVWDSVRQRVVGIESTPMARLWDWDGAQWQLRDGAPGPGTGAPTVAAYDPHRQLVLAIALNQVREWDGARWNVLAATGSATVAAFDSARGRLVVPGGTTVSEWDGAQWQVQQPLHVPGARTFPAFAYDPLHQRCVLYGGALGGVPSDDCWAYDGADWTQLSTNSPPGPRSGASLQFDPSTGLLALYGGSATTTTWTLAGATWTQAATTQDPGERSRAQFVWDGLGLLLTGGSAARGGELWRFQNGDWSELPGGGPVPRRDAGLHWDPIRGHGVLFGGLLTSQIPTGVPIGDTWIFDGRWRHYAGSAPSARSHAAMAWSAVDNALLLYGGLPTPNDTWNWTGQAWVQRTPATTPPSRLFPALAADPTGGVLLFGGTTGTASLGDQWRWNGTDWSQQTPAVMPSPRTWPLAALDPLRNVVVLASGYDASQSLQDTWEWNGNTWQQRATTPFYVGTHNERMCFRPDTGRIRVEAYTQFEWDGSVWTTGNVTQPYETGAVFATDPVAGVVRRFPFAGDGLATLSTNHAAAVRYGNGCAIGPAPALSTTGRATPGNAAFRVEATTFAPGAPTLLAIGLQAGNQPLGSGCSLLVGNPLAVVFLLASAAGAAPMAMPLPPDPGLRGVQLYCQGAVVDLPRSLYAGLTWTDGLRVAIGD